MRYSDVWSGNVMSAAHSAGTSTLARILPLAGVSVLVLAGVPAASFAQDSGAAPPPVVIVSPVKNKDVTRQTTYVGRVEAIQQTNIQARVEGYIDKVDFNEGAEVKTGDLLFSLDKGTYQAALAGAQAELKNAQASLAGAKAALQASDLTLERQTTLLKSNTVSQAAVDQAQAARDEDAAKVESGEAQIAQAQADIQSAQLNLSYTDITSPIDGRIGKANFTKGNLVNTNSGTLATVVQMDPIRVVFSIADRDYIQIVQSVDGTPNEDIRKEYVPTITLPTGKPYDHKGEVSFVDNTVDASTGTIAVRANFDNPKYVLVPGQFVSVSVRLGKSEILPVVPSGAVLEDKDGPYVMVVDKDNKAQIRRITTGQTSGPDVAVTGGLAQGEMVITEGIQKVSAGETVKPTRSEPAQSGTGATQGSGGSQGSDSLRGSASPQSSGTSQDDAPTDAPSQDQKGG